MRTPTSWRVVGSSEGLAHLDALVGQREALDGDFTELESETQYLYRVGDGSNWSEWIEFTTASSEPEPFSFNGKYTQLRYVNVWPRPIQQPRPPVWIPGGGSVETWEFCIRNNFNYSYLSYFGYQGAKDVMAVARSSGPEAWSPIARASKST